VPPFLLRLGRAPGELINTLTASAGLAREGGGV
jgi:hypothetical protein